MCRFNTAAHINQAARLVVRRSHPVALRAEAKKIHTHTHTRSHSHSRGVRAFYAFAKLDFALAAIIYNRNPNCELRAHTRRVYEHKFRKLLYNFSQISLDEMSVGAENTNAWTRS